VVRNVTGCPLAGLDSHELVDASPLAVEIARKLTANPEFYNLPRKFKVTVSGCPVWCSYPEINDGRAHRDPSRRRGRLHAARRRRPLHRAAHRRAHPRLHPQSKAVEVVEAVLRIFKEQTELRENRTRARLKYLFMRHGWTAETMLEAIEAKLGTKLDPSPVEEDVVPDDVLSRPHRRNAAAAGGPVCRWRQRPARQAHRRTTHPARRPCRGIRRRPSARDDHAEHSHREHSNSRTREVVERLNQIGLRVEVSPFWRGAIACTGTEFCKLAIAETKAFSKWLVSEMEDRLPTFDQQIRLHVTGCTNSCGQSWIADIGLEGKKIKKDGAMVDAFYFCVGGAVGKYAASRAKSASAPPPKTAPRPSNAFCVPISPRALPAKTCAPTSPAPATRPFAPNSRAPPSRQSNAMLPRWVGDTSWTHNNP